MTKKQRASAVAKFAAAVVRSLERSDNVGISAYNYGLEPSDALAREMKAALPPQIGVRGGFGVMGYMHFEKRCGEMTGLDGADHVNSKDEVTRLHGVAGGR